MTQNLIIILSLAIQSVINSLDLSCQKKTSYVQMQLGRESELDESTICDFLRKCPKSIRNILLASFVYLRSDFKKN